MLKVSETVSAFFHRQAPISAAHEAIDSLDSTLEDLDKAGATPLAVRAMNELHVLRKGVARADVIMRTSFIQSGYALLDVMVTATVLLMLASRYKSVHSEYILITFITLVYLYMLRLIRDVDDPFEGTGGGADVDLAPLDEYLARANARLKAAPAVQPSPAAAVAS